MPETAIEWATHVWNPFTGCDRVSPGCANCYAATAAASLKAREQGRIDRALAEGRPAPKVRYQADGDSGSSGPGFGFTVHWDKLENPERFPAGARVFVNSMSDVFHEEAPEHAIDLLFAVAASQPQANFLILTKRPERMVDWFAWTGWGLNRCGAVRNQFDWKLAGHCDPMARCFSWPLPNVWLGVSIENRRFVHRADLLRQTPAAVKFISAEPLLGPLLVPRPPSGDWPEDWKGLNGLDLRDIDWLIVGGESGRNHRAIDPAWVRSLRDRAAMDGVHFFFKQWGGRFPRSGGRELDGRTWDELPEPAAECGG